MNELASILLSSFERAPWGYSLTLAVIVALIKGWPAISDAALRAKTAMAEGRRGTIEDLRDRIQALEGKVEAASGAAHMAELRLVYAVNAVHLLATRVRGDNPDDPVLAQAMELLSAATKGQLPPWGARLAHGLDAVRGEGEAA